MNIYLTGIDGAGKSTIIDRIKLEIFEDKKVEVVWARYQPKLIRYLTAPFKKSVTKGSSNFNDMDESQYNKWSAFKKNVTKNKLFSSLIFAFQYFEYSFTIKKIISLISASSAYVIVDRFILDFLVDQSVNHNLNKENWIVKRLLRKLQLFDYIIFVDVDEEIAFARKNDIPSKEYLTVRRNYYKSYIAELGNAFVVTNDGSIEETIANISKRIK